MDGRMSSIASERPATTADAEPVIRIRGLRKLGLRGVDLTVSRGERVAIIGRTGEGKSVLLKSLLGVLRRDAGTIEVLGARVGRHAVSADGIGVAFQSPGLFDAFSIRRNLELATGREMSDQETRQWLARLDMAFLEPESAVSVLSGGQQKRLALARAVLRGTDLTILDEPTSGLDPETAGRVMAMLSAIVTAEERTLFLITHDYEAAAALCTRFLILTPAGTLSEVDVPPYASPGEIVHALREALKNIDATPRKIAPREPTSLTVGDLSNELLAGSLPLVIAAMALLGAILVAQSAGIAPIDVSRSVPAVVVVGVFREMAPLVVGLLLASRISARVAAEVAGMSYTAQIDTMRILGVSPAQHILMPFLVSAAIVVPACIVSGALAAVLGGAAVTAVPWTRITIGSGRFLSLAADAFSPILLVSCLVKGILIAVAATMIAYRFGMRSVSSAPEVGSTVTDAVVVGAVSAVGVDIVVSWIFFAR